MGLDLTTGTSPSGSSSRLTRGAGSVLRGAARVATRNERALGALLWLMLLAVLIVGSS